MNSLNNDITDMVEQIREISVTIGFIRIEVVKTAIINSNILWTQLLLYDNEPLPIKIDILKDTYTPSIKTIYSSPGSGLNTESDFITPKSRNISVFLVNKGYIFVGITPREDAAPSVFNFGLLRNWGLDKHTKDFSKIITLFQGIIDQDYDILGHSAGALVALNYASHTNQSRFKTVRIIDMIGQYPPGSQEFINSQISLNAVNNLISRGSFTDTDILGFKYLVQQAQTNPIGDSGFPRPSPYTGNFTNEGLLFFSLIFTGQLPGTITATTGLPGSWYLKQGFLQGTYAFGTLPTDDRYGLAHTNINTVYNTVGSIGSGIYPLAYDRDFFAVWSNSYPLVWENVRVPVFYINTELGIGDASHTISLLRNSRVTYDIVRDYGHADPVFSDTAETDFWNILIH